MPTDEELTPEALTPDELDQRRPVAPEEDDPTESTTTPSPTGATEADEADVYEQSQAVPEDPEEERG